MVGTLSSGVNDGCSADGSEAHQIKILLQTAHAIQRPTRDRSNPWARFRLRSKLDLQLMEDGNSYCLDLGRGLHISQDQQTEDLIVENWGG